ncbi:Growth-regulating factor 1 [Striga hermonthica]|uniref:Growth-regulating factor n=1 Tax=Striga hermonthica TaxID=68872 RepID=A0A9N7NPC7_STRHE|nr:Growth-regulating factor 1 [Striga hermonthica]
MDFGLACYEQTSFLDSNKPKDEKGHGSGQLKHQRSDLSENNNNNDDVLKLFKIPMPGEVDFSSKKAKGSLFSTPVGRSVPWFPADDGDGHKMLSFSSEAPHSGGGGGSSRSIAFSIYQDDHYTRAREFGLIGGGRGPFARLKGPFTPSQWMELEHQALIYKHIVANVPIPSNLLVPLKRSLYSYSLPGSYYPNLLGWGPPFHLGISGSNDPEPGRCRRTDGKKWRCSRDAVPDQKYCDRHINRGRHRSRKPVEGRTGHALSGPTTASKVVPPAGCQPLSTADNASAGLSLVQQPNSATASTDYFSSRSQEFQGLSLIPPTTTTLKPEATPFPIQKQQHVSFQEPSNSEFGVVPSDSLLNPSGRISPAHHFMEEGSWPDQLKPDWTQLSMSIPISDVQVKPGPSLQELDPVIHMGLGIGRDLDGPANKPVAWVGGPLGEALRSQAGSSPTGVLQFVSLSNSSSGSGSSPRSGGPSNDAFGSALLSSAAFRSL